MTEQKPTPTSVTLSPQLDDHLAALASAGHTTKRDILRKALALYDLANGAKSKNQRVGLFDAEHKLVTEIIGY